MQRATSISSGEEEWACAHCGNGNGDDVVPFAEGAELCADCDAAWYESGGGPPPVGYTFVATDAVQVVVVCGREKRVFDASISRVPHNFLDAIRRTLRIPDEEDFAVHCMEDLDVAESLTAEVATSLGLPDVIKPWDDDTDAPFALCYRGGYFGTWIFCAHTDDGDMLDCPCTADQLRECISFPPE